MEKHNILGKKAEASAALKEKIISLIAWTFILFCCCLVIYLSKMGLKALFLNSNKHFTLQNLEIQAKGLPENVPGLVNKGDLQKNLKLHIGTDNLFEIDLQQVRQNVNNNISVDTSEVSYVFPDTIKIDFIEKDPVARCRNGNMIDKNGQIIPKGRFDLSLPTITSKSYKVGDFAVNNDIRIPLKFIRFHESFRMVYQPVKPILQRSEVAALELIKIKTITLNNDNTLNLVLRSSPNFLVSENTLLKLPLEDFEVGLRRACIAITQNALARKTTSEIDARYSSTPTK